MVLNPSSWSKLVTRGAGIFKLCCCATLFEEYHIRGAGNLSQRVRNWLGYFTCLPSCHRMQPYISILPTISQTDFLCFRQFSHLGSSNDSIIMVQLSFQHVVKMHMAQECDRNHKASTCDHTMVCSRLLKSQKTWSWLPWITRPSLNLSHYAFVVNLWAMLDAQGKQRLLRNVYIFPIKLSNDLLIC